MHFSTSEIITDLRNMVGADYVYTDADNLRHYGQDWTRFYTPNPLAIVLPNTPLQIQQIVRYANEKRLALVPSGGRTGLSGGAVAIHGEIVISLARLNRILHFDPLDHTVTCEAGVILEQIQQFAKTQGLLYPIDFAARGSSHLGGTLATNAGGIKVIRYGLTRDWVTGLKVITGTGDVLELNKGLIKNASGYDLRHLLIGSEGTLGIFVEATLRLTVPPQSASVLLFAVPTLSSIMAIFVECRRQLTLNAFELFSEKALTQVIAKGLPRPFTTPSNYYVLVEFEPTRESDLETALQLFEEGMQKGHITDGILSQSDAQAQELWALREHISESLAPYTPYKNDISVRIAHVPAFLAEIDHLFAQAYPDFEVVWFGHIGDGNLHINILKPHSWDKKDFVEKCQTVNQLLFATLQKYDGSISAEHGVGLIKKPYLHYTRSAQEIMLMHAIKQVFDPNHILNPGKLLD